jgi:hypothetical protein
MGETEGSSSEEKSQANTKKVDQLDDPFVSLSLQEDSATTRQSQTYMAPS